MYRKHQGLQHGGRKPDPARPAGRRFSVRRSPVHGKGVFALRPIAAGERVMEYGGERVDWVEAQSRHPHDPARPTHTFSMFIDESSVIDARFSRSSSRWINHACDPNCTSVIEGHRVFIDAIRDISPGEELFYDYALMVEGRHTASVRQAYACFCGAANCRKTMLAPKRR